MVFVPQISDGLLPADPVTVKESVKHLLLGAAALPAFTDSPMTRATTVKVDVCGPVMTNVLKSILSLKQIGHCSR